MGIKIYISAYEPNISQSDASHNQLICHYQNLRNPECCHLLSGKCGGNTLTINFVSLNNMTHKYHDSEKLL